MKAKVEVVWIVLCCVLTVIICGYFSLDRTVWMDEAMLARNIVSKSFLELTKPLEFEQSAPVLYLLVAKLFWLVYPDENSLRLLSLIVSTGSVYFLSKYLLERGISGYTVILIVSLVISNYHFIRFSTEIKPYILDVLACVCLPTILYKNKWFCSAALVALFPWLSNVSIFVIISILLHMAWTQKPYRRIDVAKVSLPFIASVLALYFSIARQHPLRVFMRQYWTDDGGLYGGESFIDLTRYVYHVVIRISNVCTGLDAPYISVPLLIFFIVIAIRSVRIQFLVVCLIIQFVASLFGVYPIAQRLVLVAVPLIAFCFAHLITQEDTKKYRIFTRLVCGVIVITSFFSGMKHRPADLDSLSAAQVRKTLGYEGRLVYVSLGAKHTFNYYLETKQVAALRNVVYGGSLDVREIAKESSALSGNFIFIHTHSNSVAEISRLVELMSDSGVKCSVVHRTQNSLIMDCRYRK